VAVPDFQTLMLPVLKAAATNEVRLRDLVDRLAEDFHLTDDEKRTLLPSGRQTTLANRMGWAKTYLAKAGLARATRRGYFQATERGQEVLRQNPARIDIGVLSQFPEFENALRAELLDRILQESPAFFENTIVTLLISMGYGGSRADAGRAIGRSGDNGLDGVIDQDALGLDRVYIQAKRYGLENAVSEPDIRGFAGSLEGAKATKGVFVTTSYFTPQARAFAEKITRRIVLIDGQQLAQLMINHDVGVRIEETLHLKKMGLLQLVWMIFLVLVAEGALAQGLF
jgi:restriction system protein